MAFEDVKTNELVVSTIANLVKAAKLATDDIKAPSYAVLRIYKSTYQKKKTNLLSLAKCQFLFFFLLASLMVFVFQFGIVIGRYHY